MIRIIIDEQTINPESMSLRQLDSSTLTPFIAVSTASTASLKPNGIPASYKATNHPGIYAKDTTAGG